MEIRQKLELIVVYEDSQITPHMKPWWFTGDISSQCEHDKDMLEEYYKFSSNSMKILRIWLDSKLTC